MKNATFLNHKIYELPELLREIKRNRLKSKTIVFTNGVFDILHEGHIASLSQAAAQGDILIVGLNSDASVKRLKGPSRPVNPERSRAVLLAALLMTDAVVLFDEDTPIELIKAIMPDVLVKGGDYTVEQIAGAREVLANGGKVVLADLVEGVSTTKIIDRLR